MIFFYHKLENYAFIPFKVLSLFYRLSRNVRSLFISAESTHKTETAVEFLRLKL